MTTDNVEQRALGAFGDTSSSPPSRKEALRWLENCTQNHRLCSGATPSFIPTRLLDIGPKGSSIIRLCSTHSKNQFQPYATLSYCWGSTNHLKLTSLTSEAFTQGIEVQKMPQTSRDAVSIIADLGLQFLWIDSLVLPLPP